MKRMSSATTAMIKYLDPVMRDLGLPELNVPEDGGTAEPRILDHRRTTTHDGIEYKVSETASPRSETVTRSSTADI